MILNVKTIPLYIFYPKSNYKIVYLITHQAINTIVWLKIKIDITLVIGKLIYVLYVKRKHIIHYFNVLNYILCQ
jgi:hypothetical protein